jgi:cysteinyl-tRNA synthetase
VRRRTLRAAREGLRHVSDVIGVFGEPPAEFLHRRREKLCQQRGIDPAGVERKIEKRTAARKSKDFATADAIRDELAEAGVEIMDSPTGTTWRVAD